MMENYVEGVLGFIADHTLLTYLIIFLTCTVEALVVVGLMLPGSTLLVALGAIVASGVISWQLSMTAAIAGAILGDFLSFWIGQHYHLRIERLWPFRRYPQMIARGKIFFKNHGGKSVFLGRFIAPIRPMIPLVAGMMDMPVGNFFLFNALSAIGWVLVHMIPGLLLGGSLMDRGEISARLGFFVVILGLLLWLFFYFLSNALSGLNTAKTRREGFWLKLITLANLCIWFFFALTRSIFPLPFLTRADESVYHFLASSRTDLGDRIFIIITELGDWWVNQIIIIAVLMVLIINKKYRTAAFWSATVLSGAILVPGLKWLFQHPRPTDIYEGISSFSFPSGHATMSAIIYGFLAIILWRFFDQQKRFILLLVASVPPIIISYSRIYLGVHWLSDVLAGLALGFAFAMIMGIYYTQKVHESLNKFSLLVAVLASVAIAGSLNVWANFSQDVKRYRKE